MSKLLSPLFTLLVLLALSACVQEGPQQPREILSQKVTEKGRTPITVLVKYAFSINAFEQAVEKKFPQVDLIQVGNYTSDRGLVEYERRLEHDDLTDIVMTWPLNVGEKYWESRLIDLSSLPFTSRYNNAMLNSISSNGRLYYLPGPAQVRGIVYNKTLFEEKGWQVPQNFKEFVDLCQQIEASGIRSLQLGFGNSEVLDTAFVGYSFGNSFSTLADKQWLADYNKGNGSLDRLRPALNTFRMMMDAGIWKQSDLDITYDEREFMLFTRKCAMIEDSVLMARMGHSLTGTTDTFALMPFFTPGNNNDWARLYMVCYIGLGKHLSKPQNNEKYALALQILDYISTPEGQTELAADTGAMYSSLNNVPPPDVLETRPLRATLRHGRYAIFPELQRSQDALRAGLADMLRGQATPDDVIRRVDEQNLTPPLALTVEPIGQATTDFTLIETGNFLTDAMRRKTGADIALFLDNGKDGRFNGKGISARFYKGPQTMSDVMRVLPDLKHGESGLLQVVEMTGEDLVRTLEHSITVGADATGWFYYFSGLRLEYAPAAQPGWRIHKVTKADGSPIVATQIYKVAIMDKSVPEDLILRVHNTEQTIKDVLASAIREQQSIAPSQDGRFIIR